MSAVVVVHGGAWAIPDNLAKASVDGVKAAAREGFSVLERKGNAVDAVEAAVRAMEDNTVFNAGTWDYSQYVVRNGELTFVKKKKKKKNGHSSQSLITPFFVSAVSFVSCPLSPSAGDDANIHLDLIKNPGVDGEESQQR